MKNNIRGNIAMIILAVLSVMAIAGAYLTKSLALNRQTTLYEAYKVKSDMALDYGITNYLKEVTNYYKNNQDKLQPVGIVDKLKYEPNFEKRQIGLKYSYKTDDSSELVSYEIEKRTAADTYNYRFYDLIPSVSYAFNPMKDSTNNELYMENTIESEPYKIFSGQIDVTGVSIDTGVAGSSISTFYITTYDPRTNGIYIYSADAQRDANKDIVQKANISIVDLYKAKRDAEGGVTSVRDIFNWEDEIKTQAIYNPDTDKTTIYIAVSNKKLKIIDLFSVDTGNEYAVSYIDKMSFSNAVDGFVDFDSFDLTGVNYIDGSNKKDKIYVTVAKEKKIRVYECTYETILPEPIGGEGETLQTDPIEIVSGMIPKIGGQISELTNASAGLTTSAVIDGGVPHLYIGVILNNKEINKLDMYVSVGNGIFDEENRWDMIQGNCQPMKAGVPFWISNAKIIVTKDPGLRMWVIVANHKENVITTYSKHLNDSVWAAQEVVRSADESIGRISGYGLRHFSGGANEHKLLMVNPVPVVKRVTIVNEQQVPQIEAYAYSPVFAEVSKSNAKLKVLIEYLENEYEKSRKIIKVKVLQYKKNQ